MTEPETKELMPPEREGMKIAKFFTSYCFGLGDMFALPKGGYLYEAFLKYCDEICDGCGGAMDCSICPVYHYKDNFTTFLSGRRTPYAKGNEKESR